jgi:hypothetical protein
MAPGSGAIGAATFTITPSTSGSASGDYCSTRYDTIAVNVAIGSLPNPATFVSEYTAVGSFSACLGTPGHVYNCSSGGSEIGLQLELRGPLEIRDTLVNNGASDVQGTTQTRIAGQLMQFNASDPDESGGAAACTWTIPGFPAQVVAGYTTQDSVGSLIPLPSSALNASGLQFYWTGTVVSSQLAVQCTNIGGDGTSLSATAQYAVKVPTHTLSATYGSIALDRNYFLQCGPPPTDLWLHWGNACTKYGAQWTYSVSADSSEAGQIAGFQLVKQNNIMHYAASPTPIAVTDTTPGLAYCADNHIPYYASSPVAGGQTATWMTAGGVALADSPGVDVAATLDYTVDSSYSDYFMYLPNNSPVGPSIWVALDHLSWSWHATAPNFSFTDKQQATGDGSTVQPVWQCNKSNTYPTGS